MRSAVAIRAIPSNRLLVLQYALTIFLAAFLLFQVQPIVGKMILPWFGGSASVWTTCMLFFQVLLLLGYLYSHWIVSRLSPYAQSAVHLSLLVSSLFLLPLGLNPHWQPTGGEDPTLRILLVLAFSIGLPFFVLSTTGPLIQAWFARERPASVPYRLFALSNVGSLTALLGYPIAVEPAMPTHWQAWVWSILFSCFALACGSLAWRAKHLPPVCSGSAAQARLERPELIVYLTWIGLAACPSILLLAVTSHLTENIAPVPLLWIMPLALYLLSFIICFERRDRYSPRVFRPLLMLSLFAVAALPFFGQVPMLMSFVIHLAAFFVVCMVCHGEVALQQPRSEHLTSYYLMLAIGGAMGGIFVGVLAPYWFNDHYELSIGLVLTAAIVWTSAQRQERALSRSRRLADWGFVICLVLSLVAIRATYHWAGMQNADYTARNFYGRLKISTGGDGEEAYRVLAHGGILHGHQFIAADRQTIPTAYFSFDSGVGRAVHAKLEQRAMHVGIIGLGVGTLATYGRAGDRLRLYEINPLVVDIARSRFTYLSQTAAHVNVVLGDARLNLEKETPQGFDILIVDAFSGDAIPVHLLTEEAVSLYIKHMKPDGVLAFHVSNSYLDLAQIVKSAANKLHYQAVLIHTKGNRKSRTTTSDWVLVSADPHFFGKPDLKEGLTEIKVRPGVQAWRDDYSSLLQVVRWRGFK